MANTPTLDDYCNAAFPLMDGNGAAAMEAYRALIPRTYNGPFWLQIACVTDLAVMYLAQDDKERALDAFERAVLLGFCDVVALHRMPRARALFGDPRFIAAYNRIRLSEADLEECAWIQAEIQSIHHDTTMMITENMGRKDTDFTEVPQVPVPSRAAQCLGMEALRAALLTVQAWQRARIMESDQSRIMHLTNMRIINNMPGGVSLPDPQTLESSRQAQLRAANRRQAVAGRIFSPSSISGTTLGPPPPLGSLGA